MKTEKQVKDSITRRLNKLLKEGKIEYWNRVVTASKAGIPDMLFILNGITYFLEIKSTKGKTSPLQEQVIKKINNKREIAYVINSLEKFDSLFKILYNISIEHAIACNNN